MMIASALKFILSTTALLMAFILQLPAQICINKYSSVQFKGTSYDTFTHSIVNPKNEVVITGGVFDYNEAGHIAKFSEKGSPVWSYIYNLDYYNFITATFFKKINFSDIINTGDGGYLAAGNVEQVLSPFGLPPPVKKWGLMAKLDKYGNILWTKTPFTFGELSFTNLYLTSDGDYIAYLAADNGPKQLPGDHSYGRVLRIAPDGQIRWSTFLFTYFFDAGGLGLKNKRAIVQAADKNIVIGDVVHKTSEYGIIQEGNLHFLELNYQTGKVNWETSYEYPVPSTDSVYLPDLVNVKELPRGKFSFITTLYLPAGNTGSLIKKGVNIVTGNKGAIENIFAYAPADNSACKITGADINKNNGNRAVLIDKGGKTIIANIADNGQINWQHGYVNGPGNFPANCFSAGNSGFNIFMSNNRSLNYRMIITDATGLIDCENDAADITTQAVVLNYSHDSVATNPEVHLDNYLDDRHPLKKAEYPLAKTVLCQQTLACCDDVVDTVNINAIDICEGSSFMLPDSTIIKDAGIYDITFKTPLGCDSIKYYRIKLDKNVSLLSLPGDTCLTNNNQIILKATKGFEKYYWMDKLVPDSNAYTITQPGKYFVRVDNTCGTKTDSVEIFEQCDYPVYMPTAFTPNGDRLNDYFRIPPYNKNKLLQFNIYDRWGKRIFNTTDPAIGWDGTYKNEPLDPGSFFYQLDMMGYSGNRVSQKGYVILVR